MSILLNLKTYPCGNPLDVLDLVVEQLDKDWDHGQAADNCSKQNIVNKIKKILIYDTILTFNVINKGKSCRLQELRNTNSTISFLL